MTFCIKLRSTRLKRTGLHIHVLSEFLSSRNDTLLSVAALTLICQSRYLLMDVGGINSSIDEETVYNRRHMTSNA